MAALTIDQKKKVYWKVFYILTALTIFELGIVFAPIPHLAVTLLVVAASMSKAAFVGWIYMHLNHETKGLKIILLAPLFVAFFYAVFLISDSAVTRSRHADPYVGQPSRYFGQRKLFERKVDDFGNTVVEEKPAEHAAEGHGVEHSADAATGNAAEAAGEAKTEAAASAPAEAAASSSSSEAAKH